MSDTFGERLKKLRKKAGLSQEELANVLGLSYMTIRRWEAEKVSPRFEEIKALAKALAIPETDLLNDAPPDSKGGWVLNISIKQDLKEEVLDLGKPIPQIATIVTTRTGAYVALGGDYSLWADDAGFKNIIAELKKMRAGVLQQGKANGGIRER